MTSPLLLRIAPTYGGQAVCVDFPADARFSATIPGGFDSLTATLPWPDSSPLPPPLDGVATVQAIDRLTGRICWHGRLIDPGQSAVPGLATYAVNAEGESAALDSIRAAYCLADRSLDSWKAMPDYPAGSSSTGDGAGFSVWTGDWITDPPTGYVEATIPDGTKVAYGAHSSWAYMPAVYSPDAASQLALVRGSTLTDTATFGADWRTDIYVGVDLATSSYVLAGGFDSSATSPSQQNWEARAGLSSWVSGTVARGVIVRWRYLGTTGTYGSEHWWRTANLLVCGRRYDRSGNLIDPATGFGSLTSGGVLADLIGRLLLSRLEVDPSIASAAELVDQACWWEGVSAREILDFVTSHSPQNWWAVWEPSTSGKPRFEYQPWSTAIRYVISPGSGEVKLAGGATELANRALVTYKRGEDIVATLTTSVSVPILDLEGLVRTAAVDLRDRGPIAPSKAIALGQAALDQIGQTKPSGTVVVSGPIYDRAAGRMVQPWEIQPGCLVQTSVSSSILARGADQDVPDGVSVFRLTGVQYEAGTGSATLTLDGGGRSLLRRVRSAAVQRRYAPSPSPAR